MINYSYLARNRTGRVVRGELSTPSPMELRSRLQQMELQLISFDSNTNKYFDVFRELSPRGWLPIRSCDIELALQQLSMMLRSGLKLLEALKALQMQCQHLKLCRVIDSIQQDVSKGDSLSTSLARHSVIPQIVVQLVGVGEQTGNLAHVLEKAKEYVSQRRKMTTEVRVALAYPAVVTFAALSIAVYLITAVIPELQKFLNAMGRKLPAMTQSLVDLAQWFELNGVALLVTSSISLASIAVVLYWRPGRYWVDKYVLRAPIIGGVLRLSATASLANSLAMMTQSGIRLVDAVKISTQMQKNSYLAHLLDGAYESIMRGHALSPALTTKDGFTPILASMIEVAERAGQLDQTLAEVAGYCDSELKTKIKRLGQMVEPTVIVLAGGIVGYVYVAFFMALMSAGGNFRG
jgi:type IV pilus assembly protein PilC